MMLRQLDDGATVTLTEEEEAAARASVAAGSALIRTVRGVDVLLNAQEQAAIRAEWAANETAVAAERALAESMAKLEDLDQQSIRGLREYVAAQPDAPVELKAIEAEAAAEREKLQG